MTNPTMSNDSAQHDPAPWLTIDAATADRLTQSAFPSSRPVAAGGPALTTGTVINGRYTLLRAIAHGGMGWVYDVADGLHPERAVALKTVLGLSSTAATSLFKTEFATMTKLDHPNVARVYDFEQIQGSDAFLMTMERIDGQPLSSALKGVRDWRRVVECVVQVCRALSYMHSRRIVHFDLKPANILLTDAGLVKVVDFGIAGTQPAGHEGGMLGTPVYMAPELLLGDGAADHRADLYSLGVTLYELLIGDVPWRSRDMFELMAQINERGVRLPADHGAPTGSRAWSRRSVHVCLPIARGTPTPWCRRSTPAAYSITSSKPSRRARATSCLRVSPGAATPTSRSSRSCRTG